jgi:hypothetical protein
MTGAKTTKQARKRRAAPSKRPSVATEQKIAAKPRQGRSVAKKEGGAIHGEKSEPRLDKRPRGKVMKRAEGGNVMMNTSDRCRRGAEPLVRLCWERWSTASATSQGRLETSSTCMMLGRNMRCPKGQRSWV